jgi:hypothetical protein
MVTLEQVKLLETKVAKAIDYVNQVSGENSRLRVTLDSYRKRIDELEVLVQQFREDQGRIETGIISALDRLNQFEDAIEKSLSAAGTVPAHDPEASGSPDRSGDNMQDENSPSREPPPAAEPAEDSELPGGEPEIPEEPDLSGDTQDVQELDIF